MSVPKKKKKHGEPQLLFQYHRPFLDGKKTRLVHERNVINQIALRLMSMALFASPINSGTRILIFVLFFILLTLPIWIVLSFFINQIIILSIYVIVLLLYVLHIFNRTKSNEHKVREAYKHLIQNGEIIIGQITHIRRKRAIHPILEYTFYNDDNAPIVGTITISDPISAVEGTPIYILYADKKLHAPL